MDLQTRGHLQQVGLEGVLEVLVDLVEELDVDLLEGVAGAELIKLVMDLEMFLYRNRNPAGYFTLSKMSGLS